MRNLLLIPILALALGVAACGKKSDDGQPPIGGPVIVPPPVQQPPPITGGVTFDQACATVAGTIINVSPSRICQFTTGGNVNFHGLGNIVVSTGIAAYPYSHIFINASENMRVYVGGYYIGKGITLVNSGNAGTISFNGDSLTDSYSVSAITVTSAFNEAGQYVNF